MGALQDVIPITLPAPTGGINKYQALAAMDSQYSPWMLNWDCYPDKCKVRNAYQIYAQVPAGTVFCLAMGVYGDPADSSANFLFMHVIGAASARKIYDITGGSFSLSFTPAGVLANSSYSINYNGRLAFITEANANDNAQYDGASWAAFGFTGNNYRIGVQYKKRVYLFSQSLNYSIIAGVAGTPTSVTLTELFELGPTIAFASTVSSPGERASDTYLAFGNLAGEILVYSGDYPDSANWAIQGKYKVPKILNFKTIVNYRNDTWLLTQTGVVSLRDLISEGSAAVDEGSPSVNINDYWTRLIAQTAALGSSLGPVTATYWPERNQILCLVPGHIDQDDVFSSSIATMCVYHTIARAWSFHSIANLDLPTLGGLTYFRNNVYFFDKYAVMRVNTAAYKDQNSNSAAYAGYSHALQSAYNDLGSKLKNKKIVGIEPIMKTDFAGTSVTVKAAADMGRRVSDASAVELVSGNNAPYYSVGVDGTFVQFRIEGTTDTASTTGLELSAVTLMVVPGGRG